MRILVVDGDPEARAALFGILRSSGGSVEGTETLCDAVRSLMRQEVHLLVLDLHQPGFPCETALAMLREVAPHVPVILTTHDPAGREAARWTQAGAFRVWGKPFSAGEVLETVRRAQVASGRPLP